MSPHHFHLFSLLYFAFSSTNSWPLLSHNNRQLKGQPTLDFTFFVKNLLYGVKYSLLLFSFPFSSLHFRLLLKHLIPSIFFVSAFFSLGFAFLISMETITGSAVVASDSVDEDPSSSSVEVQHEVEEEGNRVQGQGQSEDQRHSLVFYRLNVAIFQVVPFRIRDEACSAFLVLITFWIFACLTVILGFYGSSTIQLEPNCSRLIKVNPFFVQSIQVKEMKESLPGSMLYGFDEVPPLDVLITWSEKHDAVVGSGDNKVWQYFLNPGSRIYVSYSIDSPSFAALSLVIAQGRESLMGWIEDPSYPNTTLSWNIIHGNGTIMLEISSSDTYHIALANLNFQDVEVQLNFTIEALTYNTSQACYECSLSHQLCTLKLELFGANAAVLTSPGPELGITNYKWHVKLSYSQRWISYFMGSASITVLILVVTKIASTYRTSRSYGAGYQAGRTGTERAPLLSAKDDDILSWGSSYDSLSQDEEESRESQAVTVLNGKQLEGESNHDQRRVCLLCLDAVRDCFFLPCGHCAACFACGTRVIEEAGVCPICPKATRKVRKIFSV